MASSPTSGKPVRHAAVSPAQTRRALLLLWALPALWVVNYIVARKAPGVVGPYMMAFGRWGMAAAVLAVLARQELWGERAAILRVWWQYLILGTLGMFICGAWVYLGAQSTTAMNMALIYSTAPVLITLGAVLWLGERFGLRQAAGVALAMAGVLHVIVKGRWVALADVQFSRGDGWILVATFSWAAYALLLKKWPSPLLATTRLAATCIGGVLALLPFAVWETLQANSPVLGREALGLMVLTALVPGLGAYWLYGWIQKILGAGRVAMALYLSPLYAGVAAWLFLGEQPGWHHAVGALMILPGVFLVSRTPMMTTVRSANAGASAGPGSGA
ncbi:MAG: DMT family transporter [Comamonadaceae bacterium]|nr:MAG: DMT family transporter [Comamonadaceae bacterium]